ncbi:hypothetical protein MSPP1_002616 [Malassezia sp. CBS 17886]|nr:hypothetical protein MSPP1_002616 [Malassezia sp. CBS 17886]
MARDAGLRRVAPRARPASEYAFSQLTNACRIVLAMCGFHGSSENACLVFAEVVQRFLQLLARTSADAAAAGNRTEAAPWDVEMGIEEVMGSGYLAELAAWAHEEGVWKRDVRLDGGGGPLRAHCQTQDTDTSCPVLTYAPVAEDERLVLAAEAAAEACIDEDLVWGRRGAKRAWEEAAVPWPGDGASTGDERADAAASADIPAFLPPQPPLTARPPPKPAPVAQKSTPNATAVEPVPAAADTDAVRRVWRECAGEYAGVLNDAPRHFELPSLANARAMHAAPVHESPAQTSLPAFARATAELDADPSTRVPTYMTSLARSHHVNPTTMSFRDAAFKRRRLAHCMADAGRYVPVDSLHGCVHVHPASPSYAPGASLLITLPPAKDGVDADMHATRAAPIFSPVWPHGRGVAMSPPSGALFPALGYRHPAHLYTSMRMVVPLDSQRVFSRITDPPALLDDHHTERVYHGMAVSRSLMTGTMMAVQHRDTKGAMVNRYRGGNSILHSALERLRFYLAAQLAEQRRMLHAEGQLEQLDQEPIRGERIRLPATGMLVYSWDWKPALPLATDG